MKKTSERGTLRNAPNGQVFTPDSISDFMANLVLQYSPRTILDPCFGDGIFIKSLLKLGVDPQNIIGIEIDESKVRKVRSEVGRVNLSEEDFFNFEGTLDAIIMNPPYIRQEIIVKVKNSIEEIAENFSKLSGKNLNGRSNLYLYFLLKGIYVLKENGILVAITPNIWLSAAYGKPFREFIKDRFSIEYIFEFSKDIFKDVVVESCILVLRKKTIENSHYIKFITLDDGFFQYDWKNLNLNEDSMNVKIQKVKQIDLKTNTNWHSFFTEHQINLCGLGFVCLFELASLRRGITTTNNRFFINGVQNLALKYPQFFTSIVCSPKELNGYSTSESEQYKKILYIQNTKESLPKEIREYIDAYSNQHDGKSQAVNEKYYKDNWYCLPRRNPYAILFGYIVRSRKEFFFNKAMALARDNFYEISPNPEINEYVLFAILNSSYTKYALERIGRFHGQGLLKIQKYELDKLKVIDPRTMNSEDISNLAAFGKELEISDSELKGNLIIENIDEVISKYSSTPVKLVREVERKMLEKRLSRKQHYKRNKESL